MSRIYKRSGSARTSVSRRSTPTDADYGPESVLRLSRELANWSASG